MPYFTTETHNLQPLPSMFRVLHFRPVPFHEIATTNVTATIKCKTKVFVTLTKKKGKTPFRGPSPNPNPNCNTNP